MLQDSSNITSQIKRFVNDWNLRYPIDVWWRKKYNIPFGSPQHKEMNFIDMMIDYEEDKLFKELSEQANKKTNIDLSDLDSFNEQATTEPTKQVLEMSEDEVDEEFDNLNIAEYND